MHKLSLLLLSTLLLSPAWARPVNPSPMAPKKVVFSRLKNKLAKKPLKAWKKSGTAQKNLVIVELLNLYKQSHQYQGAALNSKAFTAQVSRVRKCTDEASIKSKALNRPVALVVSQCAVSQGIVKKQP